MKRKRNTDWFRCQCLEPKCIAVDYHSAGPLDTRYEYVFKNGDYVLKQFCGWNAHLTIEDYWNGEVLAYTDGMYDHDQVHCAEMMMQNARGNNHIEKQVVEQIIYKIMTGDIKLYGLVTLDNNGGI